MPAVQVEVSGASGPVVEVRRSLWRAAAGRSATERLGSLLWARLEYNWQAHADASGTCRCFWLLAPADSSLSHARQEVTRDRRLPTYHGEEFISTASASTISGLLTFFPKCFSSFLHSTCSLSVSYLYLALEEVYLPLGALVSKYTTLRQAALVGSGTLRGSHPLWRRARAHFDARPS